MPLVVKAPVSSQSADALKKPVEDTRPVGLHDIPHTFASAAGLKDPRDVKLNPTGFHSKNESLVPAWGKNLLKSEEIASRKIMFLEHNCMHDPTIHWNAVGDGACHIVKKRHYFIKDADSRSG